MGRKVQDAVGRKMRVEEARSILNVQNERKLTKEILEQV